MSSRRYKNRPDIFCICVWRCFAIAKHQRIITEFIKKGYHAYFDVSLVIRTKLEFYIKCAFNVWSYWGNRQEMKIKERRNFLPFGVPMYGGNQKTMEMSDTFAPAISKVSMPKLNILLSILIFRQPNELYPMDNSSICSIPPSVLHTIKQQSWHESSNEKTDDDELTPDMDKPQQFIQTVLNDLLRDLGLSKDTAQTLGTRLWLTKNCWLQDLHFCGIGIVKNSLRNISLKSVHCIVMIFLK